MISEMEKAWMAALLEGEGCLSLAYERRIPTGKDESAVFTVITIHISNTNPYLIQAASNIWKRLGMKFHYLWIKNKKKNWKEALLLKCNSVGSSKKLLDAVRPYMKSKIQEADILLEYANYRESLIKNRGPDGRYKEYMDKEYIDGLINKFKNIKSISYDLSKLPRKSGEILDLSKLCSSETKRETLYLSDDIVQSCMRV